VRALALILGFLLCVAGFLLWSSADERGVELDTPAGRAEDAPAIAKLPDLGEKTGEPRERSPLSRATKQHPTAAEEAAQGVLPEPGERLQSVRMILLEQSTGQPVVRHGFHLVPRYGRSRSQPTHKTDERGRAQLTIEPGEYRTLCWATDDTPELRAGIAVEPEVSEVPLLEPLEIFEQVILVRRPSHVMAVLSPKKVPRGCRR
jgi:hypothetical protein